MQVKNVAPIGQLSDADLRLLRVFKAVVDCGGMASAELELNLAMSTISRHVKDLETRLGLVLCRRGRAGFALTPEGQQLYEATQRLLAAFRERGFPVVHVTTCYQVNDRSNPNTDMGLWHNKIPVDVVNLKDTDLWAIDSRIAPVEGEYTLLKKRASSFHGTELAGILRANNVDTILVTGVTACACVRQTICDGLADGFRTIAVKEAIGDRVPGAVAWNLFDIDAKFGDVETVDTCVSYLNGLAAQKIAALVQADRGVERHVSRFQLADDDLQLLQGIFERQIGSYGLGFTHAHSFDRWPSPGQGGCAAQMRSWAQWQAHPQGQAVNAEPLVHWLPHSGFMAGSGPFFEAYEPVRRWLQSERADVMVVFYNDHLNHFQFSAYPTFALGVSEWMPVADEGAGARMFPDVPGDIGLGRPSN